MQAEDRDPSDPVKGLNGRPHQSLRTFHSFHKTTSVDEENLDEYLMTDIHHPPSFPQSTRKRRKVCPPAIFFLVVKTPC